METFICPSDRQLALRARLGTGWSSRAQSAQRRQDQPLTTNEEEQILRVLRRNELLAESEKARVEAMLKKLDRLKQTATTKRNEECALCHKEFGHLSNLPIVCVECSRCICTGCCVELIIPQLYQQSINKRNSLFNFQWMSNTYGSGNLMYTSKHQNYLPVDHNQQNGNTTLNNNVTNTKSSIYDNRKHKFLYRRSSLMGTLNSAALHSQQLLEKVKVKTNSRQGDNHSYVCKICYEAREIWKRSGAWFYKSLPRSRMTSCPSSPSSTPIYNDCQTLNDLTDLVKPIKTDTTHESHINHTDNDSEQWIQLKPNRRPSKPEGSEAESSSIPSTSKDTPQSEAMPNTRTGGKSKEFPKSPEHSTNTQANQSFIDVSKPNSPSYTNVPTTPPSQDGTHISSVSLLPDLPNTNSLWKPQSPISAQTFHPAFASNKSTNHLTASALASSFTSNNSTQKVASLTGEKEPANLLLTPPCATSTTRRSTVSSSEEAPFGVLYFTLYHDTLNKQLHVAIHKAKNLIAMDANGLSDPYVVCQLLPTGHNNSTPRTSTRPQCLNPVWNEALTFEPFDGKNIQLKTLRLAVLDEDLYGSDWLGEYRLQLSQLIPNRLTDFTVPLGPHKPVQRGEFDLACPTRGKIQLGLGYLEDRKQLYVEVIRCANLAPMDLNGFSDPFVKLYLRPDKTKKTKQKTQIKKATLFPEFHETFFYDLNVSEAGSRTLEVTVWDFDRGPSNDFIGGLTLGAGAKAERRELWLAVFRPPYRRIEAWFQLSNRTENGNQFTTPGVCD
ncbi:hypothetical protein MN116_006295 [Schistosoma mekongi]|uniref:Rabphilin-3A n=1 Tax=Schistosoma mekongi TaxID=38744 RepID=A0AAE1ZBQ8_SCHME|nr:hypothetical protein MN116_006295 [Schistosoma mekongi]